MCAKAYFKKAGKKDIVLDESQALYREMEENLS